MENPPTRRIAEAPMQQIAVDNQHISMPPTSLVGRSDELARIMELLAHATALFINLACRDDRDAFGPRYTRVTRRSDYAAG